MGSRLGPLAATIQAAIGTNGAEYGIRSGRNIHGPLDHVPKGEAHVALAASEKAGGVGVAINSAPADLVIQPNFARVVPVDELL
ncbi:MAG TPA: hypothetical protein VN792_06860, partial [Candidatus Acidoferrales bacterium]|nr:hypothetical protein [Candidatus Acidoferrales bacterium]